MTEPKLHYELRDQQNEIVEFDLPTDLTKISCFDRTEVEFYNPGVHIKP